MNRNNRSLDWSNILFLTLSPLAAVVGGLYYTRVYGFHGGDFALFVALFFATGLSITAGYHRHFAHASYRAHTLVRAFYLVFGACAFENSALHWAADHRLHHRYTDTDLDPYNAGKGFWSSHIGWIFYKTDRDRDLSMVQDLVKDRLVCWQHRYHLPVGLGVGFGIPLTVGLIIGHPIGALLWGGLIRIVFVHHATFFINSLAHMTGTQPYSKADSSRDSWWLAFLTNGEGYHNFHHRFPSDYRNGILWYHWDPTKWLIAGLNLSGMTYRLHRSPTASILKARMEVEAATAEQQLQRVPREIGVSLQTRLQEVRQSFEQSLAQWADAKAKYREMKEAAHQSSDGMLRQWKARSKEYEARFAQSREQWKEFIRGLQRIPNPTI